jgi:hypothetical protein
MYCRFFLLASEHLDPDSHSYSNPSRSKFRTQLRILIDKEWCRDAGDAAATHMEFAHFFDAVFELLDQWTTSVSADEYVALANELLQRAQRCDCHRVRAVVSEGGEEDWWLGLSLSLSPSLPPSLFCLPLYLSLSSERTCGASTVFTHGRLCGGVRQARCRRLGRTVPASLAAQLSLR